MCSLKFLLSFIHTASLHSPSYITACSDVALVHHIELARVGLALAFPAKMTVYKALKQILFTAHRTLVSIDRGMRQQAWVPQPIHQARLEP